MAGMARLQILSKVETAGRVAGLAQIMVVVVAVDQMLLQERGQMELALLVVMEERERLQQFPVHR